MKTDMDMDIKIKKTYIKSYNNTITCISNCSRECI